MSMLEANCGNVDCWNPRGKLEGRDKKNENKEGELKTGRKIEKL